MIGRSLEERNRKRRIASRLNDASWRIVMGVVRSCPGPQDPGTMPVSNTQQTQIIASVARKAWIRHYLAG